LAARASGSSHWIGRPARKREAGESDRCRPGPPRADGGVGDCEVAGIGRAWRNNRESKDLLDKQGPPRGLSSGFYGWPTLRRRFLGRGGLEFCGERTGDDGASGAHPSRSSGAEHSHRARSPVGAHYPCSSAGPWPLILGAHRPATGIHQGCPSVAQRAALRGDYRRAAVAHRRVVADHPRPSLGGIGAAPRSGDRCPCGSIFGVAVCTHRSCSWGRDHSPVHIVRESFPSGLLFPFTNCVGIARQGCQFSPFSSLLFPISSGATGFRNLPFWLVIIFLGQNYFVAESRPRYATKFGRAATF
jgi:hypothetical protein